MTDREKAIVMAYTGISMMTGEKFGIFHKYVEDILGHPVWTHELAMKSVWEEIKEKSHDDFIKLCKDEDPDNEEVNSLPKFEVTENTLYRPIRKTGLIIEGEVVITREEFVACFNKWIRDPYDDAYEEMKRSVLDKYGIRDESVGGDHGKE